MLLTVVRIGELHADHADPRTSLPLDGTEHYSQVDSDVGCEEASAPLEPSLVPDAVGEPHHVGLDLETEAVDRGRAGEPERFPVDRQLVQ